MKFGLPDLLKITKSSQLAETPHFFSVTVQEQTFMLAAANEEDRNGWVRIIKALVRKKERTADAWIATGFLNESAGKEAPNRFGSATAGGLPVRLLSLLCYFCIFILKCLLTEQSCWPQIGEKFPRFSSKRHFLSWSTQYSWQSKKFSQW